MKLYKALLTLTLVAVAGLFTACDEEGYWDKYNFTKDTYSFEQGSHSYSLKATDPLSEVQVTVVRGTTKGNVDVPTIFTANSDIITVADTVAHFVDGSSTAVITIKIDEANIEIGKNYAASLALDVTEEELSISGTTTYKLTFVKDYNWVVAGKGMYASSFTGEQFEVQFEMAEGYKGGYYCRVAPYKKGYYIPFYLDENANVTFDDKNGNGVKDAGELSTSCPAGNYDMGVTYAGAALIFHHNPAGSYGGYCDTQNEGNIYLIAGIWNTAEGLYIAKEQFQWVEGWPGE